MFIQLAKQATGDVEKMHVWIPRSQSAVQPPSHFKSRVVFLLPASSGSGRKPNRLPAPSCFKVLPTCSDRRAVIAGRRPEDTPWEAEALYAHLKGSYWSEEAPPPRGAGPAAGWAPWPLAAAAVLPAVGLWWAASRAPAWARGRCEDGAEMRAVLRTGALPCGLASGSSATSLLSESPAAAAG
ncbi:unnamed protein product [Prorocentrum cordatum]|uniref:Uncharacterized protein n=1 Tax=Prorocentrum cordatum TaxID=2364126 RepID=A0ABN9SDF4_9DINO|nr:unnamed protein product [Polarella glacialis]